MHEQYQCRMTLHRLPKLCNDLRVHNKTWGFRDADGGLGWVEYSTRVCIIHHASTRGSFACDRPPSKKPPKTVVSTFGFDNASHRVAPTYQLRCRGNTALPDDALPHDTLPTTTRVPRFSATQKRQPTSRRLARSHCTRLANHQLNSSSNNRPDILDNGGNTPSQRMDLHRRLPR